MMTKAHLAVPAAMLLAAASAASASRVVDRYTVTWTTSAGADLEGADIAAIPVGQPQPPAGPFVGNGDVTLLYSGNASVSGSGHARQSALDWQQWVYLSKNDMWGSDQHNYYPHLSAGRVGFLVAPPASDADGGGSGGGLNGTVTMFPGNASIVHTLSDAAGSAVVSLFSLCLSLSLSLSAPSFPLTPMTLSD